MFVILQLTYYLPFNFHIQLCVNFRDCLSCSRVQFPCNSPFLMWLLLWMPHPVIRTSTFRVLSYLCPCNGFWSGSMCRAHIAFQEHQAVALILCIMSFQISDKLVALQFYNRSAKTYLCNQGGTVSHFASKLASYILNMAEKHGITLIPVYIRTHLNVEANYLSLGKLVPEWPLAPCMVQAVFQLWGQLEVDLLASSCTNQCQLYYTLEKTLPLRALGLNAFNSLCKFQVTYIFPPSALIPRVLSKFLAEYVTNQFKHLFQVAPCWIEASHSSQWVQRHSSSVPHCKRSHHVLVGWVLKALQLMHLTLWLLRVMCYGDKGSLPQSVRHWWFFGHLMRVGLAWHTIGSYCLALSAFFVTALSS